MKNLKSKPERESLHSYSPKPLPFRTPLNGISDRTLNNHYDKLYVGYVNGVYLHEWYFEILGGDGKLENAPELVDTLTESYGSIESFIKYFSECAMASRGWTVLAWDTKESRLWIYNCDAHNQGGVWGALPIIVLDVYEHAYSMDYGADRQAYLKAFWKNFNWTTANGLFKRASAIRL